MTEDRTLEVNRQDLTLAFNALIRSYNAKVKRGPGKARPSVWLMSRADEKRAIDNIRATLAADVQEMM